MTTDANLNTATLNRTLTFDQAVALQTYLNGLDSDAFPMEPHLLGALLAATGHKRLSTQVENAVQGALECALWLGQTYDAEAEETEASDLRHRAAEVPVDVLEALTEDVQTFLASNADLLEQAIGRYPDSSTLGHTVGEQIGHDFMLTRNHHGAGFWDRGLGDLGDYLTRNCEPFGSWGLEADEDSMWVTG